MIDCIFKITEPGDILRAENKFMFMFMDIKNDYQNNELNYKTIDSVINYGNLTVKQMQLSTFKRIYERKSDSIIGLMNTLIMLKEENENNND